jgi:hypothetical protein
MVDASHAEDDLPAWMAFLQVPDRLGGLDRNEGAPATALRSGSCPSRGEAEELPGLEAPAIALKGTETVDHSNGQHVRRIGHFVQKGGSSMLFALVYLLFRRLVVLARGSSEGRHNGIDILVLRHQLSLYHPPGTHRQLASEGGGLSNQAFVRSIDEPDGPGHIDPALVPHWSRIGPARHRETSRNDEYGWETKTLVARMDRSFAAGSGIGLERAFNPRVAGSNPARPTKRAAVEGMFPCSEASPGRTSGRIECAGQSARPFHSTFRAEIPATRNATTNETHRAA